MKNILLVFLCINIINTLTAQSNQQELFSCIAKEFICSKNITIQLSEHQCGTIPGNVTPKSSVMLEWFSDSEDYLLEFTITPDDNNDIDFIVFEKKQNTFIPVRTMLSGPILGKSTSKSCLGQTGMKTNEKDFFEKMGCNNTSNNFVKSITVKRSKQYALLIFSYEDVNKVTFNSNIDAPNLSNKNNFYTENGFIYNEDVELSNNRYRQVNFIQNNEIYDYPLNTKEHNGQRLQLKIITKENCPFQIEGNLRSNKRATLNIFPNPSINLIYLSHNNEQVLYNSMIQIYDSNHKLIKSINKDILNKDEQIRIDIKHFPEGVYNISFISDRFESSKQFIKIK